MKQNRGRASTNKCAHLDAAIKYNKSKPEVHRVAQEKYNKSNPEVYRFAHEKYNKSNPEAVRTAQKKYNKSNPKIHKVAQQKYNVQNPDVHREAVSRYDEQHPEINRESIKNYNRNSRNVVTPLRRSKKLIAEKRKNDLSVVQPFASKCSNLNSSATYECPLCHAKLFQEDRSRQQWCCGHGLIIF